MSQDTSCPPEMSFPRQDDSDPGEFINTFPTNFAETFNGGENKDKNEIDFSKPMIIKKM
jgi:hypothetical protein